MERYLRYIDDFVFGDIKIEDKIDVGFSGNIATRDLSLTGINNLGTTASMKVSTSLQCSTISGSLYGDNAGLLGGIIHFDDVTSGAIDDIHTIKGVFYGGKN